MEIATDPFLEKDSLPGMYVLCSPLEKVFPTVKFFCFVYFDFNGVTIWSY